MNIRAANIRAITAAATIIASMLVIIGIAGGPAAGQTEKSIHVYNMAGEPTGANLPVDWSATNSTMTASAPTAGRILFTAVHQNGVRLTVSLAAPLGQTLSKGTYVAALNEPTASRPGLALTNSSAEVCRYSNSFFEILEFETTDTTVTSLAVDLQYTCKAASEAPWTLVSLRYNSAVPTDQGAPVLTGVITGVNNEPVGAATLCLGNPVLPLFATLGTDCAVTDVDGTYSLDSTPFLKLTQDVDRPDDYFLYVVPSLSSGYRNDCWYTADGCATAGYLSLNANAGVAINTNLDIRLTRGCGNFAATLIGTDDSDQIVGTVGPDVIVSLGGDDTIDGGDGNDVICAGFGNNTVLGGAGDDRIFGSTGADIFRGQDGNDWLWGDAGNDTLRGNAGDDVLAGIDGNDDLNGGVDNDQLDGGAGDDVVRGSVGDDTVKGGGGSDMVNGNGGEDLVYGGAGSDILVAGGPREDYLYGGDGDDVLKGFGGPDVINGGVGDDVLFGGKQNDTLIGSDGTDTCNGGAGAFDRHNTCESISLVEINDGIGLGAARLEAAEPKLGDFFGAEQTIPALPGASG